MKKFLFFILLPVLITFSARAQVKNVVHFTPFETDTQSLWKPGAAGLVDIDIPFFDIGWNKNTTFGGITHVAGYPFGAQFTAGTWGKIGSGLRIEFGNERVDIDYIADVTLTMPADSAFEKGEEITINTDLNPRVADCEITPQKYNVLFQIWMAVGFGFEISGQFCFFSCTNANIIDIDMPVDTFDIVRIDTNGISLLDGMYTWPAADYFPFTWSDSREIIDLMITMPSNANASSSMAGDTLISRIPPFLYANVYFDIPNFIAALNIPYVSAFFANVENEWELGPITVGYSLMHTGFNIGLYHNQTLTFIPKVQTTLDFPGMIDYRVLSPSNSVLASGTDSSVTFTVGNKLRFRYPCQYEFMDIDPLYKMRNDFNNHTYDSIAFDFIFQMLEFHISMDDIEVIPEICVPIYYPCGPWYCVVCDWCYDGDICTPAVVFHGFNYTLGPLVDLRPNLYNVKYNWVNNHWEMQGFNEVDHPTFRIIPAKFAVTVAPTDVPCFGVNGGSAVATVTHGKPPYRYEWSNGTVQTTSALTASVSNLPAGTHYVIVTDVNGCVTFCSFTIGQPAAALEVNATTSNISCNGTSTGSIDITTTGGTMPYLFNWSNGATTEDLNNVAVGTYTLTVTDNHACTNVSSYTLSQPYTLVSTPSSVNINCFGASTGSASVSTTGGTAPYTYLWSNGGTTTEIVNIAAGAYSVTVTDFNGCQNILNYNITQPAAAVSVAVTTQNAYCNGESSGSVTLVASGGTAPYSYVWYQNGQTLNHSNAILNNIAAGDYSVIVTDANGCVFDTAVSISEPPAITFTLSTVDNLCFGESNGSITLNVAGGSGPFTFLWSNGASTQNIGMLPAGTYQVTITDNNGCKQFTQASISQPGAPLTASVEPDHVLCKGNASGSANLSVQGGTAPYFFLWSNGSALQNPDSLSAGTYTVTITDNNGCVAYSGTVIEEPAEAMTVTTTVIDPLCYNASDGSITVLANGGTTPYYFRWDDTDYLMQNNGHLVNNVSSGSYEIIITDAHGCQFTQTINVNQPDSISLSAIEGITSCWGGSDGTIDLLASGGTAPYMYDWSSGQTTEDISGATTGYYTVTVTDGHSCSKTSTYHIGTMSEMIIAPSVVQVSCSDNADGQIYLIVSGGAGDYTYSWSNTETTQQIMNLKPGVYSVIVTDANGCEMTGEYTLPESEIDCIEIPTSFTPNGDGKNDDWVINNIELYSGNRLQIFNRWGNLLYEQSPYTTPWDGTFNGNALPAETYYYILDLNNGQEAFTGTVTIIR